MLELASAQVEKGVFELRLEGDGPHFARPFVKLGAVRGRVLALVFILLAASMNLSTVPAAFFFENGWTVSTIHALRMQAMVKWTVAGLGFLIWAMVFGTRREELTLIFDRTASKILYMHRSKWSLAGPDKGEAAFTDIRKIEVFGPHREPKTPHGYVEIEIHDPQEKREKLFRFKVLSEDQLKIYPANLGRFTGKDPFGDWVDPDSLPAT